MALGKRSSLSLALCLLQLSMIVGALAGGYGYGPNPSSNSNSSSKTSTSKFMPAVFSVQGVVYCKTASGVFPLKGAVVRISCLGVDKYGYETAPFSILSRPTDANGYFLAKLSSEPLEADGVKISQCKAFLHSCRLKACPYATNINNGLSGSPLSTYRQLGSSNMRLYSVGPFAYTYSPHEGTPSRY